MHRERRLKKVPDRIVPGAEQYISPQSSWPIMLEPFLFREEGAGGVDVDTVERDEEEEKPEKGLFCRFCSNLITHEDHAVEVNDSHHHTFFNPAGIIYEIRCFNNAQGCIQNGIPSDEFTWFAGYTWSLALCGGCLSHMGWFFSSGELGFYGLIKKNLAG